MKKTVSTFICLLGIILSAFAQDTIRVSAFGLRPNTRENATPILREAIKRVAEKQAKVLLFEAGRYDFWPQHCVEKEYFESNTTDNNPKRLGMFFENIHHLVVDGGDAEFIFHDRMQPITLESCSHITLKNFSIDWEFPLMAQGVVTQVDNTCFTVEMDACSYPFILENQQVVFVGEGWKSTVRRMMEFDATTGIIQHGDNALGKGWNKYKAEQVDKNTLRFCHPEGFERSPQLHNHLVFRHSARDHAGMFLLYSKQVELSNISVYHTAGLGILGQYSEDLRFTQVKVIPNAAKGRVFSGHDDGFHLMGCKGHISIEHCEWEGLMDDPINIHGTCVQIAEVLSPTLLRCVFKEHQSQGLRWAIANDSLAFLDNKSLNTLEHNVAERIEALSTSGFLLHLQHPVSAQIRAGMAAENLTWTPSVSIKQSRFGMCRARGLLVSTPKKVVVDSNVFESSGSAILIAGDANYWFESGAVNDVLITNNHFGYTCLSSMYQFTQGVISIFPEIPEPKPQNPYHRNIRIVNNTFHLFDYPVLYARSVKGLVFSDNHLVRSYDLSPFHERKQGITLEACKEVSIVNNRINADVLGKSLRYLNMHPKEIYLKKNKASEAHFYVEKTP